MIAIFAKGELAMKIRGILAAAIACASFAGSAEAGHWLYQFDATSAFSGDNYGSFSYTSPAAVTGYTFLNPGDMDSCSTAVPAGGCAFVQLIPNYIGYDSVWFNGTGNSSNIYYFALGAMAAPGSYNTVLFGASQAATLKVSFVEDGSVPEPAAWMMMVAGFGLVGLATRGAKSVGVSFG